MFSTEMKISRSDALLDKEFHGKRALVDKELIFFLVEWKLSAITWHPAVFSSDMRKDTWVVQLWSIVFNLAIFLHQRRFLARFFLVVRTSTSESGETSEQKRGSRKTLILWSRHCAHYLSQTLWRVFDFPSQKHILVIWFPFSTRNIFSVSQIFKSFLDPQRPNPTEMCDLRYAYTSHVQKSFFSTNIRFSSRQIPGSVLNLSFLFKL